MPFTRRQLVARSLTHHRRVHVAVALGVAAATAVLCGALLVGDSVRGSLRDLVLDRFGAIDDVLVVDRFFRQELAAQVRPLGLHRSEPAAAAPYETVEPTILLLGGTVESKRRATQVQLVGCTPTFWELSPPSARPRVTPNGDEVVLNQTLAEQLQVQVGDKVLVRLPGANQVPADSPLGRKTDRVQSLADLTVVDIVPARGLGRFSLRSSQQEPLNAFLPLERVQTAIEQPGKVNALVARRRPDAPASSSSTPIVATLADLGLKISHIERSFTPPGGGPAEKVLDYYHLSSDRLLLTDEVAQAAQAAWSDLAPQPVLTYLANTIAKVPPSQSSDGKPHPGIPYSMITALDSDATLGPLRDASGQPLPPLKDDEIVLTSWAADDLSAKPGDVIRVTWFEPETTHGETKETSHEFKVRDVVPLTEPTEGFRRNRPPVFEQRPTQANDPDLTPTVEGVTDQETIDNWDPPFPYEQRRMRSQDHRFWSLHRTTAKAYVSLAAGRRLWHSRFGSLTSIRVAARDGLSEEQLESRLFAQLDKDQLRLGMEFLPLKQRSLEAARGTTPFDALFLSLSFFVIGAALLLVALLFRLGLEQRAAEIGVLLATGWPVRRVGRTLALEAAGVASLGGVAGVLGGVGYAWLMLVGLRTWWLGAIATPFLELHVTATSLAAGYMSGVGVSIGVTWFSLRALRRAPIRPLLHGEWTSNATGSRASRVERWTLWGSIGLVGVALASSGAATGLSGEAQGGAFVTGGMALLGACLLAIWRWFAGAGRRSEMSATRTALSLPRLAARNAGRNPSRSTLTIGLVAAACFLIVSMSVFRLAPTATGVGGFDLIAESAQPVFVDLNSESVREDLWGNEAQGLNGTTIFAWRVRPGDDASCNNLYQATQPRVLGVSNAFVEAAVPKPGAASPAASSRGADAARFAWAKTAAATDAQRVNPWLLLQESSNDGPTPVVLDLNTALYSLHLYGGVGQEFEVDYGAGKVVRFRVVGLLANSVLQGNLMIDERRFQQLFPEVSGYEFFLVRTPSGREQAVAAQLEDRLSDEGFDAVDSREMLAGFLSVQNTYLSTFQSLGALGLLLGTFGLATVQVRSVLERRGELALLRATGFSRKRLRQMVLGEHLVLLVGGLAVGVGSALVAVIPHGVLGAGSTPWGELAIWLSVVLVVGLASGWFALRAMAQAPLVGALRGD